MAHTLITDLFFGEPKQVDSQVKQMDFSVIGQRRIS